MTDSAATLVHTISQYQLLEPDRLAQIAKWLHTQTAPPEALGKELVRRHWLTAYQVHQLLRGRGGDLVLGPYVILELLGDGAFGRVFKARHQRMHRLVALKAVRPDLARDADVIQRFYREIEVASQLSHPNIIHAFEAGPIGPVLALVMEYVEGLDLEQMVERQGPLPVPLAVEYIRQAACGLAYAHERGLVHRDIKPSNLVVTQGPGTPPAGLVKILDFGLARLRYQNCGSGTADLTVDGSKSVTQGTPDYMSPEQALDFHGADTRSDLYSLGCTLYFLLAGRPPFAGGTLTTKLLKHQQGSAPPLTHYRSDVPPGLPAILDRLLTKQPADRYQTPGELLEALTRLQKQHAATAEGIQTLADVGTATLPGNTTAVLGRGRSLIRVARRRWKPLAAAGCLASAGLGLIVLLLATSGAGPSAAGTTATTALAGPVTSAPRTVPLNQLVTDITTATNKKCTMATARLKELCYMDRAYPLTELTPGLEGTLLIRTPCDDKHAMQPAYLSFTLAAPATVYVAFDPRAPKPPAWLGDGTWQLTREAASFSVQKGMKGYAKKFPAGRVTLGANHVGGSEATYLLFVKPEP